MTQGKPVHYPPEYDSLQDFRTQYLKLIARYWRSPDEVRKSYQEGVGSGKKSGLEWLAEQADSQQPVPWGINLLLDFDTGPQWKPTKGYGRLGWILEKQASLKLFLPVTALAEVSESERSMAVASYLRSRSSLLRPPEKARPRSLSSQAADQEQNKLAPRLSLGPASLPSMTEFLELDGVCGRVLALAAAHPEFKEDLIDKRDPGECQALLSAWLEYKCPWNIDLEFADEVNARWSSQTLWTGIRPNELTLYLPKKPKEYPALEAVALASYNQTGADHPLTCP